ncbi:MAG: hypothetical protein RMM98_17275 [Acidobacteriota bacterium]|nr:DUF1517 domain-containing protein [Blastocatellia bacterium]MDW8241355.1 hypothetical protein [Acidobacteriota bacterium]
MMTRRSWLKSLFQSQEDAIYFFGLQLIIKAFGEDTLRARLAAVINDPDGAQQDVAAKRRYIKRLVALLLEQRPYWHQVFWDYIAGRDQAEAEFDSWTAELSAMMATEHEEIDQTVDGMFRLSHDKDYVAVTIALLLSEPYPPAEIEDESLFWRSETIAQLVNGLLYLNPETILADAVFVIPGSPDDGLSEEDLMTGGWSYLRVLT